MSGPRPRRAQRSLSESERALWHGAVRDTSPLRGKTPPPPSASPETPPVSNVPATPPQRAPHALGTGLDRRSAERLRRGKRPVEARLDLHGMTQAEAHAALERFITRAAADGLRVVLVITGKGRPEEVGGTGILQRAVPRWLAEPALAAQVLAIAPARPVHGGDGALYVLLRRKRT